MKILNFGSLNLDYVYAVDHMVCQGETLAADKREVFCGGKGLNQSIALAKAGAKVYHAGCIGEEGDMLKDACRKAGADCRYIKNVKGPSGHAVIQVDRSGQNSILLFGGANRCITSEFIDEVLSDFGQEDMLLLQNEINGLDEIVEKAYGKNMRIALNPSPFNDELKSVDFNKISVFLLNEIEGFQLTGEESAEAILCKMEALYPEAVTVLTLGSEGAWCRQKGKTVYQNAYPVKAVDTTGAGDTFTGYFLAAMMEGETLEEALRFGAEAASIAVTRPGAAPSIPCRNELKK